MDANTFDAHRLVHYASIDEKAAEMVERLLMACPSYSLNISDRNVLVSLAGEVGLSCRYRVGAAAEHYRSAVFCIQ